VVENWNRVLSFARGDFFVLFADDDRYHPGFLQEMIALIEKHPSCDIVHCRVRKIDAEGNVKTVTNECPAYETGIKFIYHRMNGGREQFAPEFVVRTVQLREMGGFVSLPLAWGSDDLTWFTLALNGGISYCPKALVDWRQSPSQISETGDVVKRLEAVDKYTLLLKALVDTIRPAGEHEVIILQEIRALLMPFSDRQKAHLVAVNARHNSLSGQVRFFFMNRKRYHLKIMWLIYSYYSNITNRFASQK
jgi:glycosyltransferase involved in cell wall biosynthesis